MILPDRVLGRPGAQWMTSGVAMGPIALRTCWVGAAQGPGVRPGGLGASARKAACAALPHQRDELLAQRLGALGRVALPLQQRHKGVDALPISRKAGAEGTRSERGGPAAPAGQPSSTWQQPADTRRRAAGTAGSTQGQLASPLMGCGQPTTAASAHSGCSTSALSTCQGKAGENAGPFRASRQGRQCWGRPGGLCSKLGRSTALPLKQPASLQQTTSNQQAGDLP